MSNQDKIILDLCGGTGAWSKPYKDAGYDVRVITLPKQDVRNYKPPKNVYGILAAPPCTEFAVSGARWWKNKDKKLLIEALEVVDACVKIIQKCKPVFYALENPVGRLRKLRPILAEPALIFDPCDYGDAYTKKTLLFGSFNIPKKNSVKPVRKSPIHYCPPKENRTEIRSITPAGFARAFFDANQ